MKRIIISFFVLCIVVVISCCGCGLLGEQKFTCNVDEVKSIQIVAYDGYNKDERKFEYTVLSEISDHSYFINQLMAIETSVNWGDPQIIEIGHAIIRIEYLNGDYDMIHCNAQFQKKGDKTNSGYFFFDKNQFDALISEYATEEQ